MYEPYGYQEEGDYLSKKAMMYNEFQKNRDNDEKEFKDIDDLYEKHETESMHSAYYDNDLESVIFKNMKGEAISSIKMTDIIPSKLVKSAEYDKDTQHLVITFDNDDTIDIDLNDLINNLDAGDGLILDDAKFSVLISLDSEKFVSGNGEDFLSVDSTGVKVSHIQDAIDVEKERAISAETLERDTRIEQDRILLGLINTEKERAMNAEEAEETRAKGEERRIDNTLGTGFTTASTETVTQKFKDLNNKLTDEIANRQTAIADEKRDRENADTLLDTKISNVDTRVTNLNATVTSQGTSLSSLQSTVNSHGNSISTLQSTVSSQGNSISTLNSTVSSQGTAISTLQSTVAAQGNSISTLNSEYASLLAEINDLKRRVTALEQRI